MPLPFNALALALALIPALVMVGLLLPSWLIRGVLAPLVPDVVFHGPGARKCLALTIDDGPSGPGSEELLALLAELDVPATFFLIGSHLERDLGFPGRALSQGHELGNHLWRDERSVCLDQPTFLAQLRDTERAVERAAAAGPLSWRWFRPGGGCFHRAMTGWLAERSYRLVLASIFPWDTLRPPLRFVTAFVAINAHPGGILVLHDTPSLNHRTITALRCIVPALRRRGYRFVPLRELLDPAA